MNRSLITGMLLLMACLNTSAQCRPSGSIKDPSAYDPCNMDRLSRSFPTGYAPLREADVMWSKRTWRVIDLREKLNLPMYYPTEPQTCLMSLFDVLKCAILEGDLIAFDDPSFDDEFTRPMSQKAVADLLVQWDSTYTVQDVNDPDKMIRSPLKTEISSSDVWQYRIKEDWFFDRQRSVMEVRIIGICPMVLKRSESGEVLGTKPLFWIYFPEARPYLSKAAVFNRWNDAGMLTYDELFSKRMFSSSIYKESNVYDRTIAEYRQGIDAVLESDKIKEKILGYESDFWQY